jgi:hypothetical protein
LKIGVLKDSRYSAWNKDRTATTDVTKVNVRVDIFSLESVEVFRHTKTNGMREHAVRLTVDMACREQFEKLTETKVRVVVFTPIPECVLPRAISYSKPVSAPYQSSIGQD